MRGSRCGTPQRKRRETLGDGGPRGLIPLRQAHHDGVQENVGRAGRLLPDRNRRPAAATTPSGRPKRPLRMAAHRASRCVSRARPASSGSKPTAAALSSDSVSLPRVRANAIWARSRSRFARASPSSGAVAAIVSRASADSGAAASNLSRAAVRGAYRLGPGQGSAQRPGPERPRRPPNRHAPWPAAPTAEAPRRRSHRGGVRREPGARPGGRDPVPGRWRPPAPHALAAAHSGSRPDTPPTGPAGGGTGPAGRFSPARRPQRRRSPLG